MADERIEYTRKVSTDPSGRIEMTEKTRVIPAKPSRLGILIRTRTKKDALTDKDRLVFPPGVLRSLRIILPEALSLGGEDEEVYRATQQHRAEYTIKEACLRLLKENQDREVTGRRVAEELVHSNPTYQRQRDQGRILSDMEEGWVSDTETALLDYWPTAQEVKDFLHGVS
jgi:hypothetical protein